MGKLFLWAACQRPGRLEAWQKFSSRRIDQLRSIERRFSVALKELNAAQAEIGELDALGKSMSATLSDTASKTEAFDRQTDANNNFASANRKGFRKSQKNQVQEAEAGLREMKRIPAAREAFMKEIRNSAGALENARDAITGEITTMKSA